MIVPVDVAAVAVEVPTTMMPIPFTPFSVIVPVLVTVAAVLAASMPTFASGVPGAAPFTTIEPALRSVPDDEPRLAIPAPFCVCEPITIEPRLLAVPDAPSRIPYARADSATSFAAAPGPYWAARPSWIVPPASLVKVPPAAKPPITWLSSVVALTPTLIVPALDAFAPPVTATA
ncbi:conserved hypothetical protein [Burkholderia ambifaria IOP40-10]|uniref:Uncharacterized protein n=1 Tax=Burkholderia ambifaria IOP40-10 TaxID=396596 RepID=B1FF81_9BURK|nr:conserved hypothetical protein [Burkholderia ambifaria IOP40-10]